MTILFLIDHHKKVFQKYIVYKCEFVFATTYMSVCHTKSKQNHLRSSLCQQIQRTPRNQLVSQNSSSVHRTNQPANRDTPV